MTTVFAQNHQIAFNHVPFASAQGAVRELTSSAHSRFKDMVPQYDQLCAIEEAHRSQLHKLFGETAYEEFRALRSRITDRPAGPGAQPGSPVEIRARRADRQRRMREFLAGSGINPDQLHALNRESRAKVAGTIPPPPTRDGRIVTLLKPDDIPSGIRDGKANPWTVVRPPYPEWSWYYTGWQNGFDFIPSLFLNSDTGLVGHSNYLFDTDASDFDHAQIEQTV